MNNQCAPIHSDVSAFECEGTSLSTEEEREAKGACKCLMRPAQKGLINFLVETLKCHSQDRIDKFYRRKEWDISCSTKQPRDNRFYEVAADTAEHSRGREN